MSATSSPRFAPDIDESSSAQTSAARASCAESGKQDGASAHPLMWSWIALVTAIGLLGVSPVLTKLWGIWTADPLRSIGILVLPTSIVLILRVWRQNAWELRGAWWGLLPVALAYVPVVFSERLVLFWSGGAFKLNILPNALPVYLYACGVVLLFAGVRVWLRAWFPLALLLVLQPVPQVAVQFLDLPMQSLSAHIARSFAALLGLSPTNSELLRLMFAPDFGMFIAPGCDGMRGAITLAYGALIVGYLKRASILRLAAYVVGAFLLGHIFNLIRLCALVLYYRIALAHPAFEHVAKQADYVIGGFLFLIAAFLFLWIVSRKANLEDAAGAAHPDGENAKGWKPTYRRIAALALLVIVAIVPSVRATGATPESLVLALRSGVITVQDLNGRIPSQLGDYRLVRAWQEQVAGSPALEAAAFAAAPSDEIEIGIWLPPSDHSIQTSLMTHGEVPKIKTIQKIATAGGQAVPFNLALYDDGVTYSLTGDTYCSPSSCEASSENDEGIHLALAKIMDHGTRGKRLVPIFFKIQVPRIGTSDQAMYSQLLSQCEVFLSHVDFPQLSQRFQ